GRVVFDEHDVLSLPVAALLVDHERDDRVRAAPFRSLAAGERGTEHGQALTLVREDEAEVFPLVEPEHLAAHRDPLPRVGERAARAVADARRSSLTRSAERRSSPAGPYRPRPRRTRPSRPRSGT